MKDAIQSIREVDESKKYPNPELCYYCNKKRKHTQQEHDKKVGNKMRYQARADQFKREFASGRTT